MSESIYGRFGRYAVFPCEDGWVLQDSQPDDPAYIFKRGKKKLYAAKIIGEAYSLEAARELIRIAIRLDKDDRKSKKPFYGKKPGKKIK